MAFIGTLGFRISVPTVSFYARLVLEASAISISALMSVFFALRALGSIIARRAYGGRTCLALSSLCFVLSSLIMVGYGLAGSVILLLVLRAVHGLLLGYAWTTLQIVIGLHAPARLRGTVYAVYFAAGSIAFPLADYVYSLLASYPRQIPLLVSSILLIIAAVLIWTIEAPEEGRAPTRPRARSALAAPLLLLVTFVFLTRVATAFTMSDVIHVFLKEVFNLTKSATAALLAVASALGVSVGLPLNFLADKVSERLVMLIVGLMIATGLLLMAVGGFLRYYGGISILIAGAKSLVPLSRRIAISRASAAGIGYVNAANNLGVVISSLAAEAVYDLSKKVEGLISMLALSMALTMLIVSLLITISLRK